MVVIALREGLGTSFSSAFGWEWRSTISPTVVDSVILLVVSTYGHEGALKLLLRQV